MVGKRGELAELRARIAPLEWEMQQLNAATAMARPLLDDAHRLTSLAAEARRLSESTAAAVQTMRALTAAAGIGRPRFAAKFGAIYQATTTGYLSVNFGLTGSGVTDVIEIFVDTSSPPTELVAKTNSANHGCDYAGTIVRAGEYSMVRAERGGSGYRCIFTPLI
jgi:hypothetical protein